MKFLTEVGGENRIRKFVLFGGPVKVGFDLILFRFQILKLFNLFLDNTKSTQQNQPAYILATMKYVHLERLYTIQYPKCVLTEFTEKPRRKKD